MYERVLTPDLLVAIDDLYRVFGRYAGSRRVDGCPCCVSDDDVARLASKPLRSLSWEDLEKYSMKAMTTWGSVDDFKRFLPRILELIAQGESFCAWMAIGKLRYGHWMTWPRRERVTVRTFLESWWRDTLSKPVEIACSASETLAAILEAEDDIATYLKHWDDDLSLAATMHLVEFVDRNHPEIIKKKRLNDQFSRDDQILAWLFRDRVLERLENAFFHVNDDDSRTALSLAVMQWEQAKTVLGYD